MTELAPKEARLIERFLQAQAAEQERQLEAADEGAWDALPA